MTTASSEAPTTHNEFERKLVDIKVSKADINSVIMDYLINEGYPAAAMKFAAEANLKTRPDEDSGAYIEERVEIRNAIYAGEIQKAIEHINDLNPELLDSLPALHFDLLRLHLINLIQSCNNNDITPALTFAQTQLASRATSSPRFLDDLERTMALLIYPPDNLAPAIKDLLDPELRRNVARQVNEALLVSLDRRPEARLRSLVRLRAWAESRVRQSGKELPPSLTLFTDEELGQTGASLGNGNGTEGRIEGDEAMQT